MEYGLDFFLDFYVVGKHKDFLEQRIRWQHLNDGITLLLRAKGYEKAPMYNDTLQKFDDADKPKEEEKDDQEIIENTLKLFKQ